MEKTPKAPPVSPGQGSLDQSRPAGKLSRLDLVVARNRFVANRKRRLPAWK